MLRAQSAPHPLSIIHAAMTQPDKLQEYLQRLSPAARGNLLTELERLELCGAEIPGAASIIEILRAEFRSNGQNLKHRSPPGRYFFAPLEPLLVDSAPEHANTGAICPSGPHRSVRPIRLGPATR